MSIKVFRKVAVVLLVSTAILGAAPSRASRLLPHRNLFEDPARGEAPRGLIASLLIYILECAGGAMDPNGSH